MKSIPMMAGCLGISLAVAGGVSVTDSAFPPATAADMTGDTQTSLAERIQRARDELDIMELEVDYGLRLDNRDYEGYADNFAEEGVMHSGIGSARGHEAIEEMLSKTFGEPAPAGETVSSLHMMTNPLIELDGDKATGMVKYTFIVTGEDGRPTPRIAAHYRDRYVRENGEWKILERKSNADILPSNPMAGQSKE